MAKLSKEPIGEKQLTEFLDEYSDFSFELRVLNKLHELSFACEHGGSYHDSVTEKPREFDIRATKDLDERILRLAVECKNLREYFPLLVSCPPRRDEEAFHEIVLSWHPDNKPPFATTDAFAIPAFEQLSTSVRMTGTYSLYPRQKPVGKSCQQVGKTGDEEITYTDSDVYKKWSQALSSAYDLTYQASRDASERTEDRCLSLVFPILVIPDGRLWSVEFDAAGNRLTKPRQIGRVSYFVDLTHSHIFSGENMTVSHLEFVTLTGLTNFVNELCGTEENTNRAFPLDEVLRRCSEGNTS